MSITKDVASIGRDMRDFHIRWQDVSSETGDRQTFCDELFAVYGLDRKGSGAQHEFAVKMKAGSKTGFIDLYAPQYNFLLEGKSAGKDLAKALVQAQEYWDALPTAGRPRYNVVTDFHNFWIEDTSRKRNGRLTKFTLDELADNPALLNPIFATSTTSVLVDVAAANIMADLYDTLADELNEHDLSMWLTRILFCLYAEDTGIFPADTFTNLVRDTPAGALAGALDTLFRKVLNVVEHERSDRIPESLAGLRYVNGGLFGDDLPMPTLGDKQRDALLTACEYNWNGVNPTIFGAMFQNAMTAENRRALGEHYTSEDSIMRTLRPLILDDLEVEFEDAVRAKSVAALNEFHDRIAALHFLDPAAGCGNFLLVAYRELRKIEQRVYREHLRNVDLPLGHPSAKAKIWKRIGIEPEVRIKVANFHGIEIGEFPARIAEVAVYLEQHRQDQALSSDLAMVIDNLPLKDIADMHHGDVNGNAATRDWSEVVEPSDDLIILGNPPYNGTRTLGAQQKAERDAVWLGTKRGGTLDYVSIWFRKAAEHVRGTRGRVALVSTNSIVQGEQVAPLWGWMKSQDMGIDFAHQTFAWSNEARGMAHVHVVIIGFSDTAYAKSSKTLFTYPDITEAPKSRKYPVINSYLVPAADVIVESRTTALAADLAVMKQGTTFADGCAGKELGGVKHATLIMDAAGYREAMADPIAAQYVRPLVGADELIDGRKRWCLWLVDAPEADLLASPVLRRRVANLKTARLAMKSPGTRAAASRPTALSKFPPRHISNDHYVVVPKVSSDRREYLPCGYVTSDTVTTDKGNPIYEATLFDFAVASSRHMRLWTGSVAGRMKSDPSYGAQSTWNTFALPNVSDVLRSRIEEAGQALLDVRDPSSTLAEQYDPDLMPETLRAAHRTLDHLLDEAFSVTPGASDVTRLASMFNAYAAATGV